MRQQKIPNAEWTLALTQRKVGVEERFSSVVIVQSLWIHVILQSGFSIHFGRVYLLGQSCHELRDACSTQSISSLTNHEVCGNKCRQDGLLFIQRTAAPVHTLRVRNLSRIDGLEPHSSNSFPQTKGSFQKHTFPLSLRSDNRLISRLSNCNFLSSSHSFRASVPLKGAEM